MSLPSEGLQRRHYIDLVRRAYSKWVNPDPTKKLEVGAYGVLDKKTGIFKVEGNIYDPEFQKEFDKHNVKIKMSDHPPEVGPTESDVVVWSRETEVKEQELNTAGLDIPGIEDAPIKSTWTFNKGKTDAVFAMHNPHQIHLPPRVVLEPLYKVDKLYYKWLLTVVHVTDAYAFYLSDKSKGGKFSLALVPNTSTSGTAGNPSESTKDGFSWWSDAPNGLFRQASDPAGDCSFMPIYLLMRPIKRIRRVFIDKIRPEPSGDELWYNQSIPWDPLDEDGEEDELDPEVYAVDPFAAVEQQHFDECGPDGCDICRVIREGPPKS